MKSVRQIRNLTEAQDALRPFYNNAKTLYNLDTIRALLAFLDNPQDKMRVVHVAGTSGKTSTSYYAAALLQASGASVGLSVSPHVDTLNERVQVNGQPLPEPEFCQALSEFLELIEASGIKPSYFECMVSLAFWEFARRGLDYAVMEVGLGGLLDGTNVVTRVDKICIITDIGLDHTEILGDTLAKIAAQKAGIIQPDNEVFMYEQGPEVMQVVRAYTDKQHAVLHEFPDSIAVSRPDLPLFQQRNLGLACQAVNYVNQRDGRPPLAAAALETAAQTIIPARLERFTIDDKTVILDGSHNQQKMQAFVTSLQALYPAQPFAVLAGFVAGRDTRWQEALDELAPLAQQLIITSFHTEKDLPKDSVPIDLIMAYCQAKKYTNVIALDKPAEAYLALRARPEPVLVVTGSFYLMNHIRPLVRAETT